MVGAEPEEIPKRPTVQILGDPKEIDRKKLQKEILHDLNMFGITPNSFGKSKKNRENIKIPEKMDISKRLAILKKKFRILTGSTNSERELIF